MHAMIDCTWRLPNMSTIRAGQIMFARLHTVRLKITHRFYGRLEFGTGVMRNNSAKL